MKLSTYIGASRWPEGQLSRAPYSFWKGIKVLMASGTTVELSKMDILVMVN